MLPLLVTIVVLFFLWADLIVFIACLAVGPKLRRLCQIALWANGLLLLPQAVLVATMVYKSSPGQRSSNLLLAAAGCMPTLLPFLSIGAVYRWKMKAATPPPIPR